MVRIIACYGSQQYRDNGELFPDMCHWEYIPIQDETIGDCLNVANQVFTEKMVGSNLLKSCFSCVRKIVKLHENDPTDCYSSLDDWSMKSGWAGHLVKSGVPTSCG